MLLMSLPTMKILTLLLTLSITTSVLATQQPDAHTTSHSSVHKKARQNAPADTVIELSGRHIPSSQQIEVNTLSLRALPGTTKQ